MRRVHALLLLTLALMPLVGSAQVAYPPRAEKFDIHLRYRILAGQDERIRQYRELTAFLKQHGFEAAPREDADLDIFDPTAERMNGTIPSANALKLFGDARIQSVVAIPAGQKLPDDGKAPIQIRLSLASGFASKEQRELHEQVSKHLRLFGFVEGVSYDHVGYRVLRGALPAEHLLTLLKDLRYQPSGWFAAAIPEDQLPQPLRSVLPVRFVEVLSDLPAAAPEAPAAAPAPMGMPLKPFQEKLTTEVKNLLADPMPLDKPLRVDLILHQNPDGQWESLRYRIRESAADLAVEGQVGVVVTVQLKKASDLDKLLPLEEIRSVRLVRAGAETARAVTNLDGAVKMADLLASTRVAELHKLGHHGEGQRIVILASEFPGVDALKGKQLGKNTAVIDLTAELDGNLRTAPPSTRPGVGTVTAVVAQAAAPRADLQLVRIHPTAFHQLLNVARAVIGDQRYSESMQARSNELTRRAEILRIRRVGVTQEYRVAFSNLSDDEVPTKRREAAVAALDTLIADEETFKTTIQRFSALKAAIDSLKGATVVVNTLVWDTGYPQDGLSELDRYINDAFVTKPVRSALKALKQPPTPVWVQAASTAVGQVWSGPFLDTDGNGVMEFATAGAPVPAQRWTRELNFLAFQPAEGMAAASLPAGLKLRVTVQWREPHDPDGFLPREPVFPFTLRLLRQYDPEGKAAATDEFVEVGRSTGEPVRLLKTTASGAFEQTLEVTIPTDGVYALRVEGGASFVYQLPALRQNVEVYPRIVIEPSDDTTAAKGRVTFRTFEAGSVGVGVPGGSSAAFTMGIDGKTPQTLTGAGPGVTLRSKPDLLSAGTIDVDGIGASGSAMAAAFAGGVGASLMSAGLRASDLTESLGLNAGKPLALPSDWLKTVAPRR